jgi:hypothetical protein
VSHRGFRSKRSIRVGRTWEQAPFPRSALGANMASSLSSCVSAGSSGARAGGAPQLYDKGVQDAVAVIGRFHSRERGLVLSEAETHEPTPDIHGRTPRAAQGRHPRFGLVENQKRLDGYSPITEAVTDNRDHNPAALIRMSGAIAVISRGTRA